MTWFWRRIRAPSFAFDDPATFDACRTLVRVVYGLVFWQMMLTVWTGAMRGWTLAPEHTLWPARWLFFFEWDAVAAWLPVVTLLAALGAACLPSVALFRVGAFVGLLTYTAAFFSHKEKIDHNFHTLLAVLFFFVFLPRVGRAREAEGREAYCHVFWGAQTLVLLTYTLSGVSKLMGAALDLRHGLVSALEPDAMGLNIASNWERSEHAVLGPLMATNVPLGYAVWLMALYLEVFAIVAAFRPRLHLVWGLGLILFHVGVLLAMGILFLEPPLLLLVLFVLSPFARGEPNVEATLESVPWFGPALSAAWASVLGGRRVEHARCFVDRRTAAGQSVCARLARTRLHPGHRVVDGDPPPEAVRGARPFLTVLQELDGATVFRTNTRAWLWLLSRTGWRRAWAIALLLVPRALLDAALGTYCALSTGRRAREAVL